MIKDYCIQLTPDKATEIKKVFLGDCIKQFVSNTKVKLCAERAAWLGNDEAHYQRVWTGHDIKDLKNLITLTQIWITSDLLTKQYEGEMPGKGGPEASDKSPRSGR